MPQFQVAAPLFAVSSASTRFSWSGALGGLVIFSFFLHTCSKVTLFSCLVDDFFQIHISRPETDILRSRPTYSNWTLTIYFIALSNLIFLRWIVDFIIPTTGVPSLSFPQLSKQHHIQLLQLDIWLILKIIITFNVPVACLSVRLIGSTTKIYLK